MGEGLKRAFKATKATRKKTPTQPVFPMSWRAGRDEANEPAIFLTDATGLRWGRAYRSLLSDGFLWSVVPITRNGEKTGGICSDLNTALAMASVAFLNKVGEAL